MKQIVSISLETDASDERFESEFLGQSFAIQRMGTNGDITRAVQLLTEWDQKADAISISGIQLADNPFGSNRHAEIIQQIGAHLRAPVTMGTALRKVAHEWALRHLDFTFGDYFRNARVLFLSGLSHTPMARVMSEFSPNLTFADPLLRNGIPKFLTSIKDLERYGAGVHELLGWLPSKKLADNVQSVQNWNQYLLNKAMEKAHIIVVPYHRFYEYLQHCTVEQLGGKTIITAAAYADRVAFLRDRGVDVIIDTAPKVLPRVVGISVLEALILAALEKRPEEIIDDDLLEVISQLKMDPRVVYPSGSPKRINRFAFVIHPLSQEFLKMDRTVKMVSSVAPKGFLDAVEKIVAYAPPWIYSRVTGIQSPTGVECEGWLLTMGGTPKQMMNHSPEFTYKRLLQAASISKRLGAQIMGLGAFTKVVGDAGVTVARKAELPITTGNSYSASGALWAAADAVRRMGLIEVQSGQRINGKAMVYGATGAIGSVCCRLLAKAFDEVYLVGRNSAKLLALKQAISEESPGVQLKVSTRADRYLPDMDVIVTATSGAGKSILDIMKVKPGCVITDVARPLDLSPEDVAKRPDVLVIESGEIMLPGNPEMKDIGLPPKIVYACLAETIVLALEGRYETFTIGREIEWEKVREIYKMGLKHGMRLAAISGVNGVFSDDDIQRVRHLAEKARRKWQKKGGQAAR